MFKVNLFKTKTFWMAIIGCATKIAGITMGEDALSQIADLFVYGMVVMLRDST
jgi:hypothetical protein